MTYKLLCDPGRIRTFNVNILNLLALDGAIGIVCTDY